MDNIIELGGIDYQVSQDTFFKVNAMLAHFAYLKTSLRNDTLSDAQKQMIINMIDHFEGDEVMVAIMSDETPYQGVCQ